MADAAAGERLARRHGVVLYSAQTTYGTPVTPATSCGSCQVSWTRVSGNREMRGPGSPNRTAVKGGGTRTDWSLSWPDGVNTGCKTLLTKAQRASGVLPLVTLGFGYSDDTATPVRSADQIQDAKATHLGFSLEAGDGQSGILTAEMSGVGGLITTLTTLAPATLATTPWTTDEAVFTKGGSAYPLRAFTLSLDHNVTPDYRIPGAAPSSFHRGHTYLTEHDETITGTITRYADSGVSLQGTTISTFAMVLALTNRVDSVVLTLTFATVDFGEERIEIGPDGVMYHNTFAAHTLAIT